MLQALDIKIDTIPGSKGRSFGAKLLALVTADSLWEGGRNRPLRPVMAVVTGTHQEVHVFLANWLSGRKAKLPDSITDRYIETELMRSAGYKRIDQRVGDATVSTVFLAELFGHDLGMVEPEGVRLVCMPGAAWLRSMTAHLPVEGVAAQASSLLSSTITPDDVRLAVAFLAQLDRRTMAPVLQDPLFATRVLHRMRTDQLVVEPVVYTETWSSDDRKRKAIDLGVRAFGVEQMGFAGCLACHATHEEVHAVIAEEARLHLGIAKRAALWRDERALRSRDTIGSPTSS